jgi:hypothetical protein
MNTYRRFTCVNRSVNFYLNQTSKVDTELIIFNTDTDYPIELDSKLTERANSLNKRIRVVNNNTDQETGQPYTNIGSIRRDSLNYAEGEYYICWDDDDIFLPWHIEQGIQKIINNSDNIWAWKPHTSMYWPPERKPELACNYMEASIIINVEKLREAGFFNHQGGGEHLRWVDLFSKQKKLYIDKEVIPSYCFNWNDQGLMRGHKQSGTIDRPDNFTFHKINTKDYATGRVTGDIPVEEIYNLHIETIKNNIDKVQSDGYVIKRELVEKFIV